ncbi:MAG TPA: class E sortase [Actinomycetota bacterium]
MTRIRRFALLAALAAAVGLIVGTQTRDPLDEALSDRGLSRASSDPPTSLSYEANQRALSERFSSAAFRDGYGEHRLSEGHPFARLRIPMLGVELVVIEGVSGASLRAGAGHYPETAYPGRKGNVAIAGHRTGFGAPFRRLNELARGDVAILESPEGRYTYEVVAPFEGHANPWVTEPLDWTVIAPTETAALTLTTSDPPHTSRNRLIVRLARRAD